MACALLPWSWLYFLFIIGSHYLYLHHILALKRASIIHHWYVHPHRNHFYTKLSAIDLCNFVPFLWQEENYIISHYCYVHVRTIFISYYKPPACTTSHHFCATLGLSQWCVHVHTILGYVISQCCVYVHSILGYVIRHWYAHVHTILGYIIKHWYAHIASF